MKRISRSLMLGVLLVGFTLIYSGTAQMGVVVLDQGQFVVQQGQIQLGQGSFTLVQLGSVFQLVDQTRLVIPNGPTVTFTATLQTDGQLNPVYYVLNDLEPQGQRTIVTQIIGDTANLLTVDASGKSTGTSFTSSAGFVLFDNNLFGQFVVLYRRALSALNQDTSSFQSTGLIPQVGRAISLHVDRGKPVTISVDGKVSTADRLLVTLETSSEPQQLELLGQQDTFIGMASPGAKSPTAFRSDLFPSGFAINRQ